MTVVEPGWRKRASEGRERKAEKDRETYREPARRGGTRKKVQTEARRKFQSAAPVFGARSPAHIFLLLVGRRLATGRQRDAQSSGEKLSDPAARGNVRGQAGEGRG